MRASGRSILFTTRITGRCSSSALRSTKRVWGSGPSLASTSRSTPSTIVRPRSTSPPKSAWPGVSMMLIFAPPYRTAAFLARIVIPFSRSRSFESMTRSATSWLARNTPVCQSMASTNVVLPWSTWAMMATLRRSSRRARADVVIRGGTIVDGTGGPTTVADVGVTDGRISEIGSGLSGDRVLDAGGHAVAPGCIDIHSHYDAQVFWDPALTPSSFHGVTTVVAGNCGFSIAPCKPEHRELLARTLMHVEDMDLDTLAAGIPWDFETFPEYLDSVDRHGVGLNYGVYVGHTATRIYVMGEDAYERDPSADELAAMQAVVRASMEAGAMGFATSSSGTHNGDAGRPVPSRRADLAELEALLTPLRDLGKGVAALLPGEKIKHADVYGLQARIGRPLTWTALLTVKGFPWHEGIIEDNNAARAQGGQVWPQISVRPLTFQMNLREPFTFNMAPAFSLMMAATTEARLAAYRDPAWRTQALIDLETKTMIRPNWGALEVAESSAHPEMVDRRVVDLAAERDQTP